MLQIIVTSQSWRPVHREILKMDFVFFGAPLDVAIAANTKFDVINADRLQMSGHYSHIYRVWLVLGMLRDQLRTPIGFDIFFFFLADKIKNTSLQSVLLICGTVRDIPKLKKELDLYEIRYELVFPNVGKGELDDSNILHQVFELNFHNNLIDSTR